MADRTKTMTASFDEIEQAFELWDAQAKAGNWPAVPDPTASTEHFMLLLGEIQEGAH